MCYFFSEIHHQNTSESEAVDKVQTLVLDPLSSYGAAGGRRNWMHHMMMMFPSFEDWDKTLTTLNKRLVAKPVPGQMA